MQGQILGKRRGIENSEREDFVKDLTSAIACHVTVADFNSQADGAGKC